MTPIYKGTSVITAVYKGGTVINAVYKGTTLVHSAGGVPTQGDYTGGSGGSPTDATGLTWNDGTKTSIYHLYAGGLDWSKDVGLLIYGDGSDEFGLKNPTLPYLLTGTTGLVNVAKKHNLILLTPRAPGTGCEDGGGECWYQTSLDGTTVAQKIAWAKSLVDYIMGRYNIDKTRMVIGGYSSGAQFTTQYFGPAHANSIMSDGLMVAISYGGSPIYTPTFSAAFKQNVTVVWDTGDQDPAWTRTDMYGVQAGKAWYDSNGFANTELTLVAGQDHYRYTSGVGEYGPIMDREITKWVRPA